MNRYKVTKQARRGPRDPHSLKRRAHSLCSPPLGGIVTSASRLSARAPRQLGDGTYGSVLKAVNRQTGEVTAIKKMKKART